MKRRTCIKLALLGAGAWMAGPVLAAGRRSITDNLGIQIFTVRHLMNEDPLGTLKALSDIGYREIEMVGFGGSIFLDDPLYGYSTSEFRSLLGDLGMRAPSTQFSSKAENLAEIADTVQEIGVEYLVMGMASDFLSVTADGPVVSPVSGLDQIRRIADRLNDMGAIFKASGVGFAYHNHHMEFAHFGDQIAYDVLLDSTDPELVMMEMDIGWAKVAGVSGERYLDRFPDRFMACHLKDVDPQRMKGEPSARSPIPEMTQLVSPGKGTVDFASVLTAMDRNRIPHGYVEVDLPDDPLAEAASGYRYLRGLDIQA